MSLPGREAAFRRFTGVYLASAAVKVAALALFVYLVWRITGGSL